MERFSESEIDAAKRRVREMQNRASKFSEAQFTAPAGTSKSSDNNVESDKETKDADNKNDEQGEDKSFLIILALIMLLSKEDADNSLILALLYLLL